MHAADLWLADAVRALHTLEAAADEPTTDAILALLGLTRRPPGPPPPPRGGDSSHGDGPRRPPDSGPDAGPPSPPTAEQQPAPSPGTVTELEAEPDSGIIHDPWTGVAPLARSVEPLTGPAPQPLLARPAGRHVVASAVATTRPGRRLDTRSVVRSLARGHVLRTLPHLPVRTLRRGVRVLSSDYVRTARAKGLDERVVVLHHALRNALVPIITLGALEFGTLLSGAVLTEQVFTIPGFGKLIVDAVFNRDYAVVQGVVLFTATAYIALNLLADLAYFAVNPRMRG